MRNPVYRTFRAIFSQIGILCGAEIEQENRTVLGAHWVLCVPVEFGVAQQTGMSLEEGC